MAYYPVRTVYYFDQIVEAETAEQAMLKGEDTQPNHMVIEALGLVEIDRTAEDSPKTVREVVEALTLEPIH